MASPFPGMDPYLEDSSIRSGFHHKLATEIDAELTSQLSPEYYADTEAQVVYEMEFAMEIPTRQFSVVLRTVKDNRLITSIELLSPINKLTRADGVASYLRKRRVILNSETHLLEIDLTRAGDRTLIDKDIPKASYMILLSRCETRPIADVWPIQI